MALMGEVDGKNGGAVFVGSTQPTREPDAAINFSSTMICGSKFLLTGGEAEPPSPAFLGGAAKRMEGRGTRLVPSKCWVSPWGIGASMALMGEMNGKNGGAVFVGSTQPTRTPNVEIVET